MSDRPRIVIEPTDDGCWQTTYEGFAEHGGIPGSVSGRGRAAIGSVYQAMRAYDKQYGSPTDDPWDFQIILRPSGANDNKWEVWVENMPDNPDRVDGQVSVRPTWMACLEKIVEAAMKYTGLKHQDPR